MDEDQARDRLISLYCRVPEEIKKELVSMLRKAPSAINWIRKELFQPSDNTFSENRKFLSTMELLQEIGGASVLQELVSDLVAKEQGRQKLLTFYLQASKEIQKEIASAISQSTSAIEWLYEEIFFQRDRFIPKIPKRLVAIRLIRDTGNTSVIGRLLSRLSMELTRPEVNACYAAEALGYLGRKEAQWALVTALKANRIWLSQEAGKAIAKLNDKKVSGIMIALSTNESAYVRRGAVEALTGLSEIEVAEALVMRLEDSDEEVRILAQNALTRMGEIAKQAAEKHYGRTSAMQKLKDLYADERKAMLEEREKHEKECYDALFDIEKTKILLKNIKPMDQSDSWLNREVTVAFTFEDNEDVVGDKMVVPVSRIRILEGKNFSLQIAANKITEFFTQATLNYTIESRSLDRYRRKLIISKVEKIKDDLLPAMRHAAEEYEEYALGLPTFWYDKKGHIIPIIPIDFENKGITHMMTIVRIESEQYMLVKEKVINDITFFE